MTQDTFNNAAGILLDEFPYIRIGNAPRPLLIIPGAEVNNADSGWLIQRAMRAAFRRFARDHSVYIVHRKRGLPASYSIAEMAADYARVLRAITPNDEAAQVIGFSTGGLIAQHLAAQSPELIERLVLVVTGVRLSPEGRGLVEHWRALAQAQRWVELTTAMSEVLLTGEPSKRLLRGFMRLFGRLLVSPPEHSEDFIVTMNADLAHDTTTLLPTLRMPTLVLGGEIDPFFPVPLLQETAELIPNAMLKVYMGAGHGLTKTHKRRFEDDVLTFLAPAAPPLQRRVSKNVPTE
jgi:pimeloyl-ACP methyl ester carboxylesterase